MKTIPYKVLTGNVPELSKLRIFGSRVYNRKPGKRPAKLDHHTATGIFLGFAATNKNIKYIDEKPGRVKVGTHAIFDEVYI